MGKLIAENRRARFDYFLEETFEAGLALTGTEVKSLRNGRANIAESYAAVEGRDIYLINADIPPYAQANRFNHEPRRHRKLLLHRKQLDRLIGAVQREGRTLIPGQAGAGPGQGQEAARQTRDHGRARLAEGQGPAPAGQGLRWRPTTLPGSSARPSQALRRAGWWSGTAGFWASTTDPWAAPALRRPSRTNRRRR